ncbi:MAG: dihydropteroate synthase [Rhodospirillaceae bacterium]|nr:MAG: dihydropteroate synthase [Rhodospirillaceae bacterium]
MCCGFLVATAKVGKKAMMERSDGIDSVQREIDPPDLSGSLSGQTLHLVPAGLVSGMAAAAALEQGQARLLAGGPLAFTACEVMICQGERVTATMLPLNRLRTWAARRGKNMIRGIDSRLDRLSAPRLPFAGLSLDRPRLMGVINVTPDSFSDGGAFANPYLAIFHALRLKEAGADIIDVGGESTRPNACPVAPAEEIDRVVPVVRSLAERGVLVSIDTRHAAVMDAAIKAGAAIVNDVSALTGDPESLPLVATRKVPVILMHMQGEPHTMQENPQYRLAPLDICDALAERVAACERAGITRADICVDPGIGFGKTVAHTLDIMGRLSVLHVLGCGLLLGVSRKSFIARISAAEPPQARLPGSLAATLAGLDQGVGIVRAHDVAETRQAANVWQALRTGTFPPCPPQDVVSYPGVCETMTPRNRLPHG